MCCLVCRELLVDVDQELIVDLIGKFVVTCEHLDVTIVNKSWVSLNHVFLYHCTAWQCVVHNFKIVVDRFWCDFHTQSLLKRFVCKVKTYDNSPSDIIPHLLHCSIVDIVKVICLYKHVGTGECIRCKCSLTEWDTGTVHVGIISYKTSLLCEILTGFLHLDLSWALLNTKSEIFAGHICNFAAIHLVGTKFLCEFVFHCFLKHSFSICHLYHLILAGIRIWFSIPIPCGPIR